jgi:small GTP-binding protein
MMTIVGRVVLIGESQVGKTSIVERGVLGETSLEQKSTVGAVFHAHDVILGTQKISLQIWDTAGQERYRALGPVYYRKSRAAIAVFDLTRPDTLYALADWIKTYRENADDGFIVMAGNKSDLEKDILLDQEATAEFARGFDAECIWSSSVTGVGIPDLFHSVAQHLLDTSTPGDPRAAEQPPAAASFSCC